MAGANKESSRVGAGLAFDSLDEASAGCIEKHLERAMSAEDAKEKDFHLRHARQLIQGLKK
jgi:hypothetical protein